MPVRKRFGQHFLEPVWADKVVSAIQPGPGDVFVEIGPGRGVLTLRLAPLVARVVAVEIDRDLAAQLKPRLPPNATVLTADVLETDLAALIDEGAGHGRLRIAGNLPYNISSPILFRLLDAAARRPIVDATLMLQREVADRVAAQAGTAEYGVLSVLVQWRAHVRRLLAIPPGAFRPPPEVQSALVGLRFHDPEPAVANPELFEGLVRAMFTQRRKTIANALTRFGAGLGVAPAAALASTGLDGRRRPETLEIVEIARLADAFAPDKR